MKDYFVFYGKNASTGKPNKKTNRYSFYGEYIKFTSKIAAQRFVELHSSPFSSEICVIGTERTLRKYSLGSSIREYHELLHNMDYY